MAVLILALAASCLITSEAAKYNGQQQLTAIRGALKSKGYKKFDAFLESTGFIKSLLPVLNDWNVTVLAPVDFAWNTNSAKADMADKKKAPQIIGYHFIVGKRTFKEMLKYKTGTEMVTLNYQMKILNVRAASGVVRLGPSIGAKYTGKISKPGVFNGKINIVHGG
ncbi:hypothetical protein CLOP_g11502 [Closterium sp. NIES-67]|nr:hypothetical protein CLOP_g11502 [Closterium sp. NIES-67]